MALSAKQAVTKVRRRIMDLRETNFDEAELLDYLSDGVKEVVQRVALTWPEYCLRSTETLLTTTNVTASTANYDLASTFWIPILVQFTDSDANVSELQALSLERTLDADADGYYIRNDDIYLYPTPTASVTGGLKVYFVARPAALTSSSNLTYGDDFGEAEIAYAVMLCKVRQGEAAQSEADIWRLCEQRAQALGLRVNASKDDFRPRVLIRQWI